MSDSATVPTIRKTYTFEGKAFVIYFHAELGSAASLADLCEIHWCGTPEFVLSQIPNKHYCDCSFFDEEDPGASLISLDSEEMATIRALSAHWDVAVRFRQWLIDTVFHTSPHLDHDEHVWTKILRWRALAEAKQGVPRPGAESADDWREWLWDSELKSRPATRLQ